MNVQRIAFSACAILFSLHFPGCACPYGVSRTSGEDAAASGSFVPAAEVAALQRNLTDAEILVESVEIEGGKGYVLRGTVVSTLPAGGSVTIAETGQHISLRPYFPTGLPDLSDAGHRRLMELSATPRGGKVRCRIALDSRGAWRIVSAE